MDVQQASLLQDLLMNQRVLSLGVLIDGKPYVGLLPFAISEDFENLIVHVSRLAVHSRGLTEGSPVAALIYDAATNDPLQFPRVSIQAITHVHTSDSAAKQRDQDTYLRKLPQSSMTFGFGDFQLCSLNIESARFVLGFAQTLNLRLADFQSLKAR